MKSRAWRGREGVLIRTVDVSVDGGQSWKPAELRTPAYPMAHTRFALALEVGRDGDRDHVTLHGRIGNRATHASRDREILECAE